MEEGEGGTGMMAGLGGRGDLCGSTERDLRPQAHTGPVDGNEYCDIPFRYWTSMHYAFQS
jgi:hypothetical protein